MEMIKSIAIERSRSAFLPEAYAYRDYFRKLGYTCDFVYQGSSEVLKYDAVILFHGFHPFWKKYPRFIIGEYHSLSTGSCNRFKDLIKRLINIRADIYIYLNEEVRRKMWFSKRKKYVTRAMGYNISDFEKYSSEEKKFDIIYCGSYREGVIEEVEKLADLGFIIALVGMDYNFNHRNITAFGKVTPSEARRIICQARYGLNYTPDIFPFNIQDSTKIIEYCAAGLGVITNKYKWVNNFEKSREAKFLNLDTINSREDILNFNFIVPDVFDLDWDHIIENTYIIDLLQKS